MGDNCFPLYGSLAGVTMLTAKKHNHYFTRYPPLLGLTISRLFASMASAESMTFIKEYTYMASDIDSKVSNRVIALEQVKRALLEQIGTYLISETEIKDFQMARDQIITLTAGIVSAEVIDEKWDGRSYYLKAKIAADPKEVAKSLDTLRNDRQKNKELEESKKQAEDALREVERIKHELESVRANSKKQNEYNVAIKELSSADWFDKGSALDRAKNYKDAVEAFNKSIELNPQNANAYGNRGVAHYKLGDNQQAINDYDKAIELNPQNAVAYYNRGAAYYALGNNQQAIRDRNEAIDLNPQYAEAYSNRGAAHYVLGNNLQAIKDYNKAIALNPRHAIAYYNRGTAYCQMCDNQRAIKDFNKVIELNPQHAGAYYNRGIVYGITGNKQQAIDDYKIAAKLGHKKAQDYLKSKGIQW